MTIGATKIKELGHNFYMKLKGVLTWIQAYYQFVGNNPHNNQITQT